MWIPGSCFCALLWCCRQTLRRVVEPSSLACARLSAQCPHAAVPLRCPEQDSLAGQPPSPSLYRDGVGSGNTSFPPLCSSNWLLAEREPPEQRGWHLAQWVKQLCRALAAPFPPSSLLAPLTPVIPCGGTEWSSRLVALAWPSAGSFSHVGIKPEKKGSLTLPLFNSVFQINKAET